MRLSDKAIELFLNEKLAVVGRKQDGDGGAPRAIDSFSADYGA